MGERSLWYFGNWLEEFEGKDGVKKNHWCCYEVMGLGELLSLKIYLSTYLSRGRNITSRKFLLILSYLLSKLVEISDKVRRMVLIFGMKH